ncbi:hypothetical protein [Kibdelosporangium aridum]|uniref:hypothetical protein n=1 Tax=Kibdelosporangium aridum TaxID=2030 RepID=UPI000A7EDB99|nr:hypothetical protein [Kibdelosporangium aridum]
MNRQPSEFLVAVFAVKHSVDCSAAARMLVTEIVIASPRLEQTLHWLPPEWIQQGLSTP